LAGPRTIGRDRAGGEPRHDLPAALGRLGARAARLPLITRAAGAWPARRRAGRAGAGQAAQGRDPRQRLPWWAVPALAAATAVAVALAWATVSLVRAGLAATRAAASVSAGPLVAPAPRTAGNLPRRFDTTTDPADQLVIARIEHKFSAVAARLLAAARRGAAAPVTTTRPSGLYGQPGHLDPATSRPSWIVYLGLQSPVRLGTPDATISSLMMGMLGPDSRIGPWPVPAGHRGGKANCTVAWPAGVKVSYCGWATGRTIGLIASPARQTSVGELAILLIQMRYDLQRGAR
jgi:hypothetical protein